MSDIPITRLIAYTGATALRVIVEFFVEENKALEDDFTDFDSRSREVDIACKTIFCRYEID